MDADLVVVGAGAVGASVALHAARDGHRVLVLDKEAAPGLHQSGRNSGVIHAGYNLKPGSQKARYCVEGSRQMRAFCQEQGVAMRPGGILVVAAHDGERPVLAELERRGRANGVRVRLLDAEGLRGLEPHAAGVAALHAPDACSLDASGYVRAIVREAEAAGARFRFGVRVRSLSSLPDGTGGVAVAAGTGTLRARWAVNAAGLHADTLARRLAPELRIVPFRGTYAELREPARGLVRSHVYAAPDLAFPFLGIHLSRRTDGRVLVGPGAMLALGREADGLLGLRGGGLGATLAFPGFWRMLARRQMRSLVGREVAKSLLLRAVWREARRLVPRLRPADLVRATSGNRAQVVDRQGMLVEDIVVRRDGATLHVLNAVSPGLTCSLPFGRDLARQACGGAGGEGVGEAPAAAARPSL